MLPEGGRMRKRMYLLLIVLTGLGIISLAQADWVTKDGFIDYAQHAAGVPPQEQRTDGMPDFDQRQDGWFNGQNQWNWCGPVAAGNCLWWFDSKFEMIKCISLPPGSQVRPPAVSDHYSLISAPPGGLDDHSPQNVIPFITALGNSLPGGVPFAGITPNQMKTMIENYFASAGVNVRGHFKVTVAAAPTFELIYHQVEQSQDLIVLLGFWQLDDAGNWGRFGGHYLTVAGVDTQNNQRTISLSDPIADVAEAGGAGIVWNGWLIQHVFPGHVANVHNDAGNVSHDHYPIQGSGSPGGSLSAGNYGEDFEYEVWQNFQGLNVPENLQQYQSQYNPNRPVHTELEAIVYVCPSFDYGDLQQDYPTIDITSCGPAHPLTNKAWLGEGIDCELQPRIFDQDNLYDDGVQFIGLPWTPGNQVQVNVSVAIGQFYAGEPLYLNAWKDGNIDGDFDDGPLGVPEDDFLACDEWVIQDVPVAAGLSSHIFCDPGVLDIGTYDLIMRFRLTSQPVGRFGYGGYWGGGNSNGLGTYDIDWVLGEVEDYSLVDQQLAVDLESFDAIAGDECVDLAWITASETDVDYYSLTRSAYGSLWSEIARIESQGNGSSRLRYSFRDMPLSNGTEYTYRLSAVYLEGSMEVLAETQATPEALLTPTYFELSQNYPNPFNAVTEIQFALSAAGRVSLQVFNAAGQVAATLTDEYMQAGRHTVVWDASRFASGIYLYRLTAPGYSETRKMVLIK